MRRVLIIGARETMRDVDQQSAEESPYECFQCGNIVVEETNPGGCPDCGAAMRNRRIPLE
jgi:rubrerythrin